MTDADSLIQRSLEANPLREPLLRSAIQSLHLPPGSRGLDAGCGIGLQASLLAQAVGPAGRITGMDIVPELLSYGNEMVSTSGTSGRIAFCAGDVGRLPFEEDAFDWAWSADCIGYPLGELAPFLEELLRVVKPGGSVILLGWSSQQLLPGLPAAGGPPECHLLGVCSIPKREKSAAEFPAGHKWVPESRPGRRPGADIRGRCPGSAQQRRARRPDIAVRDAVGRAAAGGFARGLE